MPSTLRYEGPDLDELLLEIRAAYGPNPKIVEANKLRRGGLAGFFAKEQYEVVIELDGRGPVQGDARVSVSARGAGAFLDAELDAPALPPVATTSAGNRRAAPAAAVTPPNGRENGSARLLSPQEQVLLRHSERQQEAVRRATATGGLSTQKASFGSMLDRMSKDAGVNPGRWAGQGSNDPARGGLVPATGRAPDRSIDRGQTMDRLPARYEGPGRVQPSPSPLPARAQRALRTLGVPFAWLCDPEIPSHGGRMATIAHIMRNVPAPEPIPSGPGVVLAIAGTLPGALDSAREIAAEMGIDPLRVHVVSMRPRLDHVPLDCWLSDLASIRERRDRWRKALTPSLVVVDASLARHESAKARQLLRVLEPTLTWGVVESTRKSADVLNWADRLGGLDALVVTEVDATVSPAAVLSSGIPVARIDGRIATSVTWTGLLNDRLTDLIARKK